MDTIFSHFKLSNDFDLSNLYTLRIFSLHPELYILAGFLIVLLFFVFILSALVQNLREQIEYLNEEHEKEKSEMMCEMEREAEEQLREMEREMEKEIEMGLGKELEETVRRCVLQCLDQYFTEKEKRENEELLKKYLNSEEEEDAQKNPREEENSFMLRFSDTEDEDAPWNEEDAMEEEATSRKEKNPREEDEDEDAPWNEEDAMEEEATSRKEKNPREEDEDEDAPWNEEDAIEENSVKLYENIKKEYREKNPKWLADKYTNLPKGKVLDVSQYTKKGKIVRVMRSPLKRPLLKSKKIQVPGLSIVSNNRSNLINALQDLGYTDPHIEDWLVLWDDAASRGTQTQESSEVYNDKEESNENSKGKEEEDDEEENSREEDDEEENSEESSEESSSDNYDEEHPSDEDFDTDDLGERLESLRGIRRKDKDTKEEIASLNEYLNVK